MTTEFKPGDRVFYIPGSSTLLENTGTVDSLQYGRVWVKWDDGELLHTHPDELRLVSAETAPRADRDEIKITLHTSAGDVVTSYPTSMVHSANALITSYLNDGKHFTAQWVTQHEQS
jgi:hypothetical protein